MTKASITKSASIIPVETIEKRILLIRSQKIMLDSDIAELYGVTTARLNEQVSRNKERFPDDFMFQLTKEEYENLISQIAISSWGGRRKLPYAFTEHGVAMLSAVLKSPRAVEMSVYIVRVFIKLREMLASHKDLAQKMADLELEQAKQSRQLATVCRIINKLLAEPIPAPKGPVGFRRN